jgi:pyrophosphate--fructose-6-phosphate 1-phosphotransferase
MVAKVAFSRGGFARAVLRRRRTDRAYTALAPEVEIIAYRYGYQGLLQGDALTVTPARPRAGGGAARVRAARRFETPG